jgi:hypothetical protein
MIFLKLLADLGCGALNAWGGYSWHNARRYLMPLLIAISVSIITHVWWSGFMVLPTMGTLCIGYSKDGNFGRALWIGLQCTVFGLGLAITNHFTIWLYLPYIIGGCILGGLYRNWNQIIGDLATGFYISLFIFLVH